MPSDFGSKMTLGNTTENGDALFFSGTTTLDRLQSQALSDNRQCSSLANPSRCDTQQVDHCLDR